MTSDAIPAQGGLPSEIRECHHRFCFDERRLLAAECCWISSRQNMTTVPWSIQAFFRSRLCFFQGNTKRSRDLEGNQVCTLLV
jgi:hypothetical protein